MYDVLIVGGGPAGLSAAMLLGRCMRKVALFDTGVYRNSFSDAMNGFITRDGTPPQEFLRLGRKDLEKYEVAFKQKRIVKISKEGDMFEATDEEDQVYLSRKVLLATGLCDRWPKLPGAEPFYGSSIHHCPYCDGYESKNKPLAAYGKNRDAIGLSLSLKTWSSDVMLFTDGTNKLTREDRELLARNDVKINTAGIERLEGEGGHLQRIVLRNGEVENREAMFFSTGSDQHSDLAQQLHCDFTSKGVVKTYKHQMTNVPGLYVAGDAARDMQLVIVAAAEGTKAAVAINMELQKEFRK
ncbi:MULTISPECIES: NAD(P)/FAD-dependent oxidoreductase [Rufibacter]|uniref:Thioredoxin reductase n=1 Tax=Rufibacter quisquiliarum TaxID=1549639 RepID=A0A839GXF6_9BACT|nr:MULTISPECIES: NAD(P)/FAD-dependent oxidoreductase [Rufibacter]MBA9078401.1 thioredoxin reductase [Rufibacter quisquiliarum]